MSASVQRPARLPALANLRRWRLQLSTEALIALTSLFFAVAGNGLFWHSAMASHPGSLRYALSLLLLLLGAPAQLIAHFQGPLQVDRPAGFPVTDSG